MTPIASTPAARGKNKATGHRSSVRRTAAPSAPRRVSGPARGTATTPRRVSGPSRPARPRSRRRPTAGTPLGARAATFVKALPDHALLDRIIRGRAWIPLLGVLLAGIVAMQVEVLKLGAGIGRSIERGTQLQSRNELLRASVAELGDDQRIERLAAGMGMVMPAPEAVNVLSLRPVGYVQRAADSIHQPDPTAFAATLPAVTSATGDASSTGASTGTGATGASTPSTDTGATGASGTVTAAGTTYGAAVPSDSSTTAPASSNGG